MAGFSSLIHRLTSRSLSNDRVGVSFNSNRVSVARVMLGAGDGPQLQVAAFRDAQGDEEIQAVLTALVEENGLKGCDCVAVIPQPECKLVQLEIPDVPDDEMKDAVRWKLADLIECPWEEASYDLFRLPSSNQVGRPDLMYVAVVRKSRIQAYTDIIKAAGLNLKALDITELVLRNISALAPEDVNGAALLYLHGNGGMLTMTNSAELYLSRGVDAGIDVIPAAADVDGDHPGLDRLVLDLQRSFDYYESYFARPAVSGLLVGPVEQGASELNQFLSSHLGTLARSVDLNSMMKCFDFLTDQLQARCLCAVGAALRKEVSQA